MDRFKIKTPLGTFVSRDLQVAERLGVEVGWRGTVDQPYPVLFIDSVMYKGVGYWTESVDRSMALWGSVYFAQGSHHITVWMRPKDDDRKAIREQLSGIVYPKTICLCLIENWLTYTRAVDSKE